jgi:hypothetical protein
VIAGAMSGRQWRVIAIVIVGIIVVASIWAGVDLDPDFRNRRVALGGVPLGAIVGAIVGVIIKKWKGWGD